MAYRAVTILTLLGSLGLAPLVQAQDYAQAYGQDYARQLTLMGAPDPASRQVSVVVRAGLASNHGLPEGLALARSAMLAGTEISAADLAALAERGDGLAAQKYVRLLLADPAANPSDIAFFATVAVSTGRVWTLPDAIAALHRLDPATEPSDRTRAYIAMLYAHAWAGNAAALDAVIDLNGEGRLFGALSEETRARIMAQDAANGDGRAALRMALRLLSEPALSSGQAAMVQDYLTRATAGNNLSVSVTATHLLAQRAAAAPVLSQ